MPRVVLVLGLVLATSLAPRRALAEPTAVGPVVDGQTLAPIAGATVTVGGSALVATTDAAGMVHFAHLPDGKLTLHIAAPHYEATDDTVDSAAELADHAFVLFPPGFSAGEVIEVKGEAHEPVPPAPGEQELTRAELSKIPGSRGDALQSIKSLPGVATVDAPGSGPGLLVVRGSAPEDSLITIDGIEVPIAYHFFGLQSVLPTEFIDSIDFQPGGFGVEYGRATGGVLNLKTRAEQPKKVEGFVESSFLSVSGLAQGPLSKAHDLSFAVGLRRSTIDLILPAVIPSGTKLAFTTAPTYYDGQLRVDWRPRYQDRVSLFGLFSVDVLSLITGEVDPNEPLLTGKFDNQTSFTRLIATWAHEEDRWRNTLVGSVGTTGFRVDVGTQRHLEFDTRRIEVRDDLGWTPSERFGLRLGGEARANRAFIDTVFPVQPSEGTGGLVSFSTTPPVVLDEVTYANLFGAYLAADLHPTPATTLTSGLRLDHFQRFHDTTLSPRVQLQHRLDAQWTLRAAVGEYSRHAEQSEALTTTLDPEFATQYVVGADLKAGGGLTASLSGFYTDRRNLVVQDAALAMTDPEHSYVNRGYGRSFGVEAILRWRRDDWFGWLAYTLSKSDRVDGPGERRRLFDFDQTHIFVAVASYKWRKWEFGGRWQYATSTPLTPVVGSVYESDFNIYLPVLGPINSDRGAANHRLDLRVDRHFQFRTWELSAFLDITNVYAHPATLGYRYNFDYSEREAIKELPIVPAFGVRGSF